MSHSHKDIDSSASKNNSAPITTFQVAKSGSTPKTSCDPFKDNDERHASAIDSNKVEESSDEYDSDTISVDSWGAPKCNAKNLKLMESTNAADKLKLARAMAKGRHLVGPPPR